MADNFAVTAGSGTTLASDDIGGVQYRRTKVSLGADGSATDAVGGAGAVSAAVQRVTLASDDPAVTLLTNLSKAEDAAHSSADQGIQALTVRKDTAAATGGTDGDYQPLITGASGHLHTADKNVATLTLLEDAAHTTADPGIQLLTVRKNTAAATSGTDGDYQPLVTDTNGRLHVLDANSATIAALSKAEDAAHTTGDTGIPVLTKRTDAPAVSSGTDGDYSTLNVDADGKVWVTDPHKSVTVTPTVSTGAYAQYDAMGGKQTLTSAALVSGGTVTLESVQVIDKSGQKPQLDIVIFNADPTAATITDNAAFVASTDVTKIVARIPVVTADYQSLDGTLAVATVANSLLRQVLTASGSANLFAAVVSRGTPTLVSTGDLIFRYGVKQR